MLQNVGQTLKDSTRMNNFPSGKEENGTSGCGWGREGYVTFFFN